MKIRFSLKWLLLFIIAIAVVMGMWLRPPSYEKKLVHRGPYKIDINEQYNKLAVVVMQVSPTDKGLERLKKLENVTELDLSNTQISNDGLKHLRGLRNLTKLNLSNTQISDDGLKHLEKLNLSQLILTDTKVSETGVRKLEKALPNCEVTWNP